MPPPPPSPPLSAPPPPPDHHNAGAGWLVLACEVGWWAWVWISPGAGWCSNDIIEQFQGSEQHNEGNWRWPTKRGTYHYHGSFNSIPGRESTHRDGVCTEVGWCHGEGVCVCLCGWRCVGYQLWLDDIVKKNPIATILTDIVIATWFTISGESSFLHHNFSISTGENMLWHLTFLGVCKQIIQTCFLPNIWWRKTSVGQASASLQWRNTSYPG